MYLLISEKIRARVIIILLRYSALFWILTRAIYIYRKKKQRDTVSRQRKKLKILPEKAFSCIMNVSKKFSDRLSKKLMTL